MGRNARPEDRRKRRLWLIPVIIIAALVLIILFFCIFQWRGVQIMWWNWTSPTLELDNSEYTQGTSYEGVQYADVSESDTLNLYVPTADDPAPLFVLVHGGGFRFDDADSRPAQFMYRFFRDSGYACASLNYRLSGEALYPAAIEDVKAAVRFLRANEETYGYDADKIVIWGESAGGYLAAMAAVTADDEFSGVKFIGEEDLSYSVSSHIDGLVDFYGCMDLATIQEDFRSEGVPSWLTWASSLGITMDIGCSFEEAWLGKPVAELTQDEINEMDPRYYIQKNWEQVQSLKVYICHGTADISVPINQSRRLCEAFETGEYVTDGSPVEGAESGGNVTYIEYEKYKHADDRFYSDENLEKVTSFLRTVYD
ncbi:MAG: alpha/beta hydrolase [Clostridia bacterium]|nr:alpha/beta hydrolase [Clostridia bacterium]